MMHRKSLQKYATLATIIATSCIIAEQPLGIIGGQNNTSDAYVAFISSSGIATPITTSLSAGFIHSVGINGSGQGIIGGYDNSFVGYVAFVSPSGTVMSITPGTSIGQIYGVAINDSGQGIIGGQDSTMSPYAAVVYPLFAGSYSKCGSAGLDAVPGWDWQPLRICRRSE